MRNMGNSSNDFTATDCFAEERKRIDARREALGASVPLPPGRRPWGLALSGGGIRSATFALGVLQSLAKDRSRSAPASGQKKALPLLARFDYLSTVSGGGYVGAFLSALFRPAAARGADGQVVNNPAVAMRRSDEAYERMAVDPPGRMTSDTNADTPDFPLRWLRDNGRYMAPSGTGDLFYAACLQIRNWCAVQYVIGIALLAAFLTGLTFRAATQWWSDKRSFAGLIRLAEASMQPDWPGEIWWSPWFWSVLLIVGLLSVPIGVAYWFTYRAEAGVRRARRLLTSPVTAAWLLLGCLAALMLQALAMPVTGPVAYTVTWIAFVLVFAVGVFWSSGGRRAPLAEQRVRLTRWLAASLRLALCVFLLGMVETIGQSLYLLLADHFSHTSPAPTISAAVAAAAALLPLIRKIAGMASADKVGDGKPKVSAGTVLAVVAVLLSFLLATVWYMLALALFFGGANPMLMPHGPSDLPVIATPLASIGGKTYVLALLATTAFAVCAAGYFTGFLNLSSLATLYSARLTRAYLGASNLDRFGPNTRKAGLDVSEPHPQDDFKPVHYFDSTHYGPLHLINVTINSTSGPGDNLTQMDRKGLPLTVTPAGISVNGAEALPFVNLEEASAGAGPVRQTTTAANTGKPARIAGEQLTIGQWIGISGAAFSPGIGRGTTLGMATLCTLANVRLGYWWNSRKERANVIDNLSALVGNQRFLLREMRGRFFGTAHRHWYLTDGGHFENTAVYELLRRRCEVVVACDDGADGNYEFEDLANLMRLARIDFGADFTVMAPTEAVAAFEDAGLPLGARPALGNKAGDALAGEPGQLKKVRDGGAQCAIAYRVSYRDFPSEPTLLLVIKPRLTADAPLDLLHYQATHADFPQESTLDQFFDEAQWESYRKLGAVSGDRIFGA